jgi:predicted Kef-type K+ transport protein
MLAARGIPALLYRRDLSRRETVAAGLLQATNLSFIVVVADLGVRLDQMRPVTADALVVAGLLSVLLFPALAHRFLPKGSPEPEPLDAASDEAL